MICYRDMTFCVRGDGCVCPPERRLKQADVHQAMREGLELSCAILCGPMDERTPDPCAQRVAGGGMG